MLDIYICQLFMYVYIYIYILVHYICSLLNCWSSWGAHMSRSNIYIYYSEMFLSSNRGGPSVSNDLQPDLRCYLLHVPDSCLYHESVSDFYKNRHFNGPHNCTFTAFLHCFSTGKKPNVLLLQRRMRDGTLIQYKVRTRPGGQSMDGTSIDWRTS